MIDAPEAWFRHAAPVVCVDAIVDVTAVVVPELKVGVDDPAEGVMPEDAVGVTIIVLVISGLAEGA